MRFSNKFVVVTGAAGGIGSAITRRFLSEGAQVSVQLTTEPKRLTN